MSNHTLPNKKVFLEKALTANGYHFSSEIQEKFLHYLKLLQDWNRVFNLTAIRNLNDMILLHLLDSLSIHVYLHGTRVIDVGSGAGLPGIPLALIFPDKEFVLLDSNSKKTRFLTQAVIDLKITNSEVIHSRSEDFFPEKKFDSVLSRAFSSLAEMLEKTKHLTTTDGQFLAMKGMYPAEEIQAISNEFELTAAHKIVIEGLEAKRHLICLRIKK